jgi:predicted transcriptional regulator
MQSDERINVNRTTIRLPQNLKARAIRLAREQGISLGELIRQSLASQLNRSERQATLDTLFADKAVYPGMIPAGK